MRLECFKDVIELCNSISTFAKTIGSTTKKMYVRHRGIDRFEQISRDNEKGDATTVVKVGDEEKPQSRARKSQNMRSRKPTKLRRRSLGKMLNTFDGIKNTVVRLFSPNKLEVFDPALVRPGVSS
jgi:ATP-dependent Zn protease